jgi:hypothetical protein
MSRTFTWMKTSKRELAARKKRIWSAADFLDDDRCPKRVKRFVMEKLATELVEGRLKP